jgi:KDO2-lipid IV(A) lauroyltransferase
MRAASAVPIRWRASAAAGLAAIDRAVSVARREGLRENLDRLAAWGHPLAGGAADRARLERAIFRSYHRGFLDYAAAGEARGPGALRIAGAERLYRALAAGRGAVVTAPHLGSWERAGLALARRGFRLHVVTGVQFHAAVTAAERHRKERARISVSTPEEGFLPLLRTLRAGGIVVLLADGDVRTRSVPIRFFGAPTPMPLGPANLARRAGAPIVHAYTIRDGDGDLVVFESVDAPDPRRAHAEDLARLTEGMARAMERAIAAHPAEWCIFRPLAAPASPEAHAAHAGPVHAA